MVPLRARGYTPNESVDSPGNTLTIADGKKRKTGGPSPHPLLFLALECPRPLAPPARFLLSDVDVAPECAGIQFHP